MAPTQQKVAARPSRLRGAARVGTSSLLAVILAGAGSVMAADSPLRPPDGIPTHADGRMPVQRLYAAYLPLVDKGWQVDVVAESQPPGTTAALPIVALRSPKPGQP